MLTTNPRSTLRAYYKLSKIMAQNNLIYPTIALFLYDFHAGLGQSEEKIKKNRHQFWRKIYPQLHKDYSQLAGKDLQLLAELGEPENSEVDYVELFAQYPHKVLPFGQGIDGYYYALQLSDSYGLQVEYSGSYNGEGKPDYHPKPLRILPQHKAVINARIQHQTGKLGQTWLLWCQLNTDIPGMEEMAGKCYHAIASHANWERDKQGEGKIGGGRVYEFWRSPKNWEDMGEESHHYIIWVFPASRSQTEIGNIVAKAYPHIMRLCYYRHKILWAYGQSQQLKQQLKDKFKSVQEAVQTVSQMPGKSASTMLEKSQLKELQKTLTESMKNLSEYAIALNQLQAQGRTMEVNQSNYSKRVPKLGALDEKAEIEFLLKFGETAQERYLERVKTDYANLSPGLTLLENLITTIKGTIEIHQAASDRALNSTVQDASIGLAASCVTATILSTQVKSPGEKGNLTSIAGVFLLSLVTAIGFVLIWKRMRPH